MMDKSETAAAIRAVYAARVAGDIPRMLSYFADDACCTLHGQGLTAPEAPISGRAALAAVFGALVEVYKFEDWTEIALLVDGDRAALHWRARVTAARTGAAETFDVFDFVRFRGGKIVELDQCGDTAKLMRISGL